MYAVWKRVRGEDVGGIRKMEVNASENQDKLTVQACIPCMTSLLQHCSKVAASL